MIDHLIPLEHGGSNSIKKLWPECHRTSPWNAQVKDNLEDKLHELVCSLGASAECANGAVFRFARFAPPSVSDCAAFGLSFVRQCVGAIKFSMFSCDVDILSSQSGIDRY